MSEEQNEVVATNESTDKKCPSCGGVMDFDPAGGTMKCPYCDYTEAIEALGSEQAKETSFDDVKHTGNCDWGVSTKTVICQSCGGEMIYDSMQIAGECPYCGSNQITEAADKNSIAPSGLIPFQFDSDKADEYFKKWIKSLLFCPNEAKKCVRSGAFKGVYLPYWTFDAKTFSHYSAKYGIEHRDSKGHTHTNWHNTSGIFAKKIDDELVIGSTQYDESMLSRIEPFDTGKSIKYEPKYIAGFVCERYSVGIKDAWIKAKAAIKRQLDRDITDKIKKEHRADSVKDLKIDTDFSEMTYKYLLLPVWMSSFKYEGKIYKFLVNGQTGRVSGKAPISPWKVALAVVIGLAVLGIILYLCSK